MICRECLAETEVVETRDKGTSVTRRRRCPSGHTFPTEEHYRDEMDKLRNDATQLAELRKLLSSPTLTSWEDQDSRPAPL